jgi:hypothetical protein
MTSIFAWRTRPLECLGPSLRPIGAPASLSGLDPDSDLDVVCEAVVEALVIGHHEDDIALFAVRNDG